MTNLFTVNEKFTNGFNYSFLDIISLLSLICSLLVITSKNPIVSVLFLIGLFFNVAGYLMMLGINFIGLSYLLVYVGAVSILFLFILMLINVRISELLTNNNNSVPLAVLIPMIFNLMLVKLLPVNFLPYQYNLVINHMSYNVKTNTFLSNDNDNINYAFSNIFNIFNNNELLLVTSQIWDGFISENTHITTIGNILYTAYPIWLLLTSIILLLAMVGAIIITIK